MVETDTCQLTPRGRLRAIAGTLKAPVIGAVGERLALGPRRAAGARNKHAEIIAPPPQVSVGRIWRPVFPEYLNRLAVVDFDYVEVKTVYPFTRRDEITSLLVEILSHIDENLREEKQNKEVKELFLIKRKTVKILSFSATNVFGVFYKV